jgi:hypothetical protein
MPPTPPRIRQNRQLEEPRISRWRPSQRGQLLLFQGPYKTRWRRGRDPPTRCRRLRVRQTSTTRRVQLGGLVSTKRSWLARHPTNQISLTLTVGKIRDSRQIKRHYICITRSLSMDLAKPIYQRIHSESKLLGLPPLLQTL